MRTQGDLAKDLFAMATNITQPGNLMEKFDVGVYQQFDKNGRKHSVLTVDCSPRMYNELKGKTFRIGHMGDHTLHDLDELLAAADELLPARVG